MYKFYIKDIQCENSNYGLIFMSFIEKTFPGYNGVNLHYMEKLISDKEHLNPEGLNKIIKTLPQY